MKLLPLLLCCLLLTGCSSWETSSHPTVPETTASNQSVPTETTIPETEPPDPIQELLDSMTVEERVGQLFLARCSDATALTDISQYHLGGFVLFGADFREQTPQTMTEKLSGYQAAAKIPLLVAVDEEGGTVTRVSSNPAFRESKFASPRELYSWGGMEWVLAVEEEKCQLLSSLGINVNLGPVCDITTDPSAFMYRRSFGEDADATGNFVASTVRIMNAYQVGSVLKHFPGYGNNTDTHTGIAVDSRSLQELEGNDLIPFRYGMEAGCGAVMVSHTIIEAIDPELPASLSKVVHYYLRGAMDFDGVIITDDLVMQAITDQYGAGEAAVMAVQAGNDLLCSTEYALQYEAVLAAVQDGRIDMEILNTATYHVLQWKANLGLIL